MKISIFSIFPAYPKGFRQDHNDLTTVFVKAQTCRCQGTIGRRQPSRVQKEEPFQARENFKNLPKNLWKIANFKQIFKYMVGFSVNLVRNMEIAYIFYYASRKILNSRVGRQYATQLQLRSCILWFLEFLPVK